MNCQDRRGAGLLRIVLWTMSVAIAAGSLSGNAPGAEPRRPNFVFVYTDDQRWDAMSVVQREQGERARFPWLKTPNMDRLASEGIRFRNAFVVNSLCAPSRASYLTGRYGYFNGIVNNHTPFPAENVTYARLLQEAGYRTGYVGKWHMGSQHGQRPGFDYSASFIGQGRYVDCPFEINGQQTATKGWVDDVSTDFALGFIREYKDQPFMLAVGFKSAHGPFDPPDRLADAYAGEAARPVPNLNDQAIYTRSDDSNPFGLKPVGERATNLGYFRCLTAADENLGRILQVLDELNLSADTMVVFAADNGFYLGEHRLGDKRSAYDESLRIPLLVRYPRLGPPGRTIDRMALNIDLAPTLLDFAGLAIPPEMQGRSLRSLLEGREDDWRKAYFYCYFYERGYRVPTVTAVRTETAKLVRYPGHDEWTEIFDLAADPYELKNLIDDPAHAGLRQDLEAEYQRQSDAVQFQIPPFADDPKQLALSPALNAWVLSYRFDQSAGDEVADSSGRGNNGRSQGTILVAGRDGRKALQFDGRASIDVPKSSSLDPAVAGWTVEAVFKAEKETGIILAHGGASNGYALHLVDGKPTLTVRVQKRPTRISASKSVVDQWVHVRAEITPDQKLRLFVDGKQEAAGELPDGLRTPADGIDIGADMGSALLDGPAATGFVGLIESVRVYSGLAP
jgi:arylsulfatase A-like enzyme